MPTPEEETRHLEATNLFRNCLNRFYHGELFALYVPPVGNSPELDTDQIDTYPTELIFSFLEFEARNMLGFSIYGRPKGATNDGEFLDVTFKRLFWEHTGPESEQWYLRITNGFSKDASRTEQVSINMETGKIFKGDRNSRSLGDEERVALAQSHFAKAKNLLNGKYDLTSVAFRLDNDDISYERALGNDESSEPNDSLNTFREFFAQSDLLDSLS